MLSAYSLEDFDKAANYRKDVYIDMLRDIAKLLISADCADREYIC